MINATKTAHIFGLGPSGAVLARRFAEKGYKVKGYEIRDHIAGNLYDYVDINGVLTHKYGPHIFQTSDKEVIEYVKKFSEWKEFRHKVNVVIDNIEVPLPINFKSIEKLFDNSIQIKDKLLKEFPNRETISILDLLNIKDEVLKEFGNYVYKNVFENYTIKMWGIDASEIDRSVLKRVPIRLSYDDGYFTDDFQAVPKYGYTKFIENILNHENIEIELGVSKKLLEIKDNKTYINGELTNDIIVFTGPLDVLFEYKYGSVPYRSLKFEFERLDEDNYQERAVVNYPAHETMTRITDYKMLSQQSDDANIKGTTIGKEFPGEYDLNSIDFNEPYYPINNENNNSIIIKYMEESKNIKNIIVIGRLPEYKYKQMAHAFKDALNLKI